MPNKKINLVFTFWEGDSGAFFESGTWFRLTKTDNALWNAKTWGEFRTILPEGEFEELVDWYSNGGDRIYWDGERYLFIPQNELDGFFKDIEGYKDDYIIRASDNFEPESISGVGDGDYPTWIGSMYDDFPLGFNDKYGEWVTSFVSGSWWEFPMDKFEEMKAYLSKHGFSVVKTDRRS